MDLGGGMLPEDDPRQAAMLIEPDLEAPDIMSEVIRATPTYVEISDDPEEAIKMILGKGGRRLRRLLCRLVRVRGSM